ncbi:MAG: HD domain-containing protein [Lachnospiraceae bacterium]|nr:HD domain-containing protein [Lachnospiraceae bacterium]
MEYIKSKDIYLLMRDILKLINPTLMEHGSRVAYIVYKMLQEENKYEEFELADIVMIATMHDIGAYKTERKRINDMLQYETRDSMAHSIYGYLFFKYLSPEPDLAKVIMYHCRDYEKLQAVDYQYKDVAAYLNIAEKIDIYANTMGEQFDPRMFQKQAGAKLSATGLDRFYQCDSKYNIREKLKNDEYKAELNEIAEYMIFSNENKKKFLDMLIYCLGFVREGMVLDTVTTICICEEIASRLFLPDQEREMIYYAALVHDLGMIAISQDIVMAPRKLRPEEIKHVHTHVGIMQEKLEGKMDAEIVNIALAHHERGDMSGYPKRLNEQQISIQQGVLQVADVVSALVNKRSYREAMSKQQVLKILNEEVAKKRFKRQAVMVLADSYDEIMARVKRETANILKMYQTLNMQFQQVSTKYKI